MEIGPEQLWDLEEIKNLKARYFFMLDTKDWAGWRSSVFIPDVQINVPNTWPEPIRGIENFIARVSQNTQGAVTVHHGHTPIVEFVSHDKATGIWAMEDIIHFSPSNPMLGQFTYMHGYGHYHDEYVRSGEGWRIAAMELRRLHLERR